MPNFPRTQHKVNSAIRGAVDYANLNTIKREDYVLDLIELPWSLDNLKKAPHRIRKLMIKFKAGKPNK